MYSPGERRVCGVYGGCALYAEPYDPERPVVCFDETSKQLLAEISTPSMSLDELIDRSRKPQSRSPSSRWRIRKRLEFHYTPKHGSWLNMAEIEFSVLARRVLRRRIADEETLSGEIAALEAERNQAGATIDRPAYPSGLTE